MIPPHLWSQLTWPEIGALPRETTVCLLPVGATEQHGPHLGTGMDSVAAEQVCFAASAITGALVLPTLPYGCSLGHSQRWPGTITLTPAIVIELVTQIIESAAQSGFHRFLVVNGHVTNQAPLRCALETIRSRSDQTLIAICNLADLSPRVRKEFLADAHDWHANAAETALMMAKSPEMVRMDKISESDDPDRTAGLVFAHPVNHTSQNGVTGHPTRASAEQGEKLFAWMVDDLVKIIRKAATEQPPLSNGYKDRV